MVQFENVMMNQRVEVLRGGEVLAGTVRYKGLVSGEQGDWVGVELDLPVGLHGGTLNGRCYFMCPYGHGIFTPASHLRWVPLRRALFNSYRPVRTMPLEVDDDLFSAPIKTRGDLEAERERFRSCLDLTTLKRISRAQFDEDLMDEFAPKYYPQRHPISSTRPPATALNQSDAARRRVFGAPGPRRGVPSPQYTDPALDFIRAPSIPRVHMPHGALKRQVRRGWTGTRPPTNMSVCTARDSFDYDQWRGLL